MFNPEVQRDHYRNVLKFGLAHYYRLDGYLKDALQFHKNHRPISGIDRRDWVWFNDYDPQKGVWYRYQAILTDDLKSFDLYQQVGTSKSEVAEFPVSDVLAPEKIKKFHLPAEKSLKHKTSKSKSVSKSHTPKHTIRKGKTTKKSHRRSKLGRKRRKSTSHKAKK